MANTEIEPCPVCLNAAAADLMLPVAINHGAVVCD